MEVDHVREARGGRGGARGRVQRGDLARRHRHVRPPHKGDGRPQQRRGGEHQRVQAARADARLRRQLLLQRAPHVVQPRAAAHERRRKQHAAALVQRQHRAQARRLLDQHGHGAAREAARRRGGGRRGGQLKQPPRARGRGRGGRGGRGRGGRGHAGRGGRRRGRALGRRARALSRRARALGRRARTLGCRARGCARVGRRRVRVAPLLAGHERNVTGLVAHGRGRGSCRLCARPALLRGGARRRPALGALPLLHPLRRCNELVVAVEGSGVALFSV